MEVIHTIVTAVGVWDEGVDVETIPRQDHMYPGHEGGRRTTGILLYPFHQICRRGDAVTSAIHIKNLSFTKSASETEIMKVEDLKHRYTQFICFVLLNSINVSIWSNHLCSDLRKMKVSKKCGKFCKFSQKCGKEAKNRGQTIWSTN